MQTVLFTEAVNGCKSGERARLMLAWIAAERLKREMRGIPPLKAISAPWPMRKARTARLTDVATEIDPSTTEVEVRGVVGEHSQSCQDKSLKESLLSQTVTTPPTASDPSGPIESLVYPPSQSPSPSEIPKVGIGSRGKPGQSAYPPGSYYEQASEKVGNSEEGSNQGLEQGSSEIPSSGF
jgi:hypothetical protein